MYPSPATKLLSHTFTLVPTDIHDQSAFEQVIYMPQFEVVGSLKLPLNPHGDRKGQRVTLLSWIPRVDAPDSLVAGLAGFSVVHLPNAAIVLQPSIHGLLARCGLAGKGESVGQRTGRLYRAGLYASMDTSVSTTTPSIEAKFEGYQSRWGREVAEATVEELASAWHESKVLVAGGVTPRPRLPRLICEGQTSGRDRSADGEGEDREFKVGRRFGADHSACATRDERGDDIESMSHELIRTVAEDVVGSDRAQGERVGWGTSVLEESPAVPGLKVNSSFPKVLRLTSSWHALSCCLSTNRNSSTCEISHYCICRAWHWFSSQSVLLP